jgi:hypothetical protein
MSKPVSVNFPYLNMTNLQMIETANWPYKKWSDAAKKEDNICKAFIRYVDWCSEAKSFDSPADVVVFFEFLEALVCDTQWCFIYKLIYPLQTDKEALRALSFIRLPVDK